MAAFRRGGRGRRPVQVVEDSHRVNDKIGVPEVRLISDKGEQLGVMETKQALEVAERRGLDLVEVSPNAKPPVCKLMDYGKYKYKEQKKEAEAKKKRSEVSIKEIRIRYRTDSGDLETKLKKARGFFEDGDKVKFSMRFRGREIMYLDLGSQKLDEVIEELSDVATVDERSPAQGRQIYVVLAPVKQTPQTKAKPAQPKEEEAESSPSS